MAWFATLLQKSKRALRRPSRPAPALFILFCSQTPLSHLPHSGERVCRMVTQRREFYAFFIERNDNLWGVRYRPLQLALLDGSCVFEPEHYASPCLLARVLSCSLVMYINIFLPHFSFGRHTHKTGSSKRYGALSMPSFSPCSCLALALLKVNEVGWLFFATYSCDVSTTEISLPTKHLYSNLFLYSGYRH